MCSLCLYPTFHFSVLSTHRPLGGHGCQNHWIWGEGTPCDVQCSACLFPCGTEPGSCNDTAFSPICGLTVRQATETHRETRVKLEHPLKTARASGRSCTLHLPFTTSVRVRLRQSPCFWFRTRMVYCPASSSATSRITRECPFMRYREHCSAATVPSFNLIL